MDSSRSGRTATSVDTDVTSRPSLPASTKPATAPTPAIFKIPLANSVRPRRPRMRERPLAGERRAKFGAMRSGAICGGAWETVATIPASMKRTMGGPRKAAQISVASRTSASASSPLSSRHPPALSSNLKRAGAISPERALTMNRRKQRSANREAHRPTSREIGTSPRPRTSLSFFSVASSDLSSWLWSALMR